MRFRHRSGATVLVSYCTNVHAARHLSDIIGQLDRYAQPVREKVGWAELGLGLWLPQPVAAGLAANPADVARLRRELRARGLAVVTMNGFPYRDFHDRTVKKRVYRPTWRDRRRLDYTVELAHLLAELLPGGDAEGSISTLPLGWRVGWTGADTAAARGLLDELDRELAELSNRAGRTVRVGLEPEPGCIVERADDVVAHLSGLGDHVGVCLDTCHLAVGFESAAAFLAALQAAGLPLVKLQAACAIEASRPADPAARADLRRLAEPRYLHQVRTPSGGGVQGVDDLPEAGTLPVTGPWRVHFHAPLHRAAVGALSTTQAVLADALGTVLGTEQPQTTHVEVETYTWNVLPDVDSASPAEADLVSGIANELLWLADQLRATGLEEVSVD